MSLTEAQVNAFSINLTNLANAQATAGFSGELYSLIPQSGNYAGNGVNDYWNVMDALRPVIEAGTTAPGSHNANALADNQQLESEYRDVKEYLRMLSGQPQEPTTIQPVSCPFLSRTSTAKFTTKNSLLLTMDQTDQTR